MAVLAIKTEQRCKLCNVADRAAVDHLLERRSNLESDDAGNRINLAYVLRQLGEWGVVNPTADNIKTHWRKHCEVIDSEIVESMQHAALAVIADMERNGVQVDVNQDLDWMWAIGMAEMRERVLKGDKSGVSIDLLLKIAAEKTRRQHSESQDELIKALAGGVAAAFAPVPLGRPPVELPEVIADAEFEEVVGG